ncbi:MAG TPA: methylase, partial [Porphyromonadaceae bacterium]|nr:methylase [Porphyromonadaceae bacterium]
CLYAEHAGLFDKDNPHTFGQWIKSISPKDIRDKILKLFSILNQEEKDRDYYLQEEDKKFPYVNGNLFNQVDSATEEVPNFTEELKRLLVEECSQQYKWQGISPTIFGAVFESTLNQDTRRKGGMHY